MTMTSHEHEHEHGTATAIRDKQAASASVALDIGDGQGALVIYPSEHYRGLEIEISRADGLGHRVHTGVHDRATRAGTVLTAIFGSLETGEYVVLADETTEGAQVIVTDGELTEIRLG
jgi:hypothetical protein